MNRVNLILIALSVSVFDCSAKLNELRDTKQGIIKGAITQSNADPNVEFYSFKGIPYARPPLGKLRFQEPLPPKKWFGIRDASQAAQPCVQFSEDFMGDEVIGSEDCLYLEVYEPITAKKEKKQLLPVMVWIHGGTFVFGSANNTQADYFMEEPVILVTIQYRLNVFGFLSMQIEAAKGNAGLKDQQAALRWVQQNIKTFGGDPNKVTIFGESAGGASVQYQLLSKKSRGLFQRAISQSGSALNRWALQEDPKETARRLAKGLGITVLNSFVIVKKLQDIDPETLLRAAFNPEIVGFFTPFYAQPFAPMIEDDNKTAFISQSPFSLLQAGDYAKVPYIIGFNTEEGSFGYDYISNGRVDINIYEERPDLLIPISMKIEKGSNCYQYTLDKIKEFYFDNGPLTDKAKWIDYMSQELFVRGIMKSMQQTFKEMPVYLYRFSYAGSRQLSYLGGVGHYEEVRYLFYPQNGEWSPLESEKDELTRKRLIKLWTNFASAGEPTPESDDLLQNVNWETAYPDRTFLDVGDDLVMDENPNFNHTVFWEKLFGVCGYPPYKTY